MGEKAYTSKEVTEIIDIPDYTLKYWQKQGLIRPSVRQGGFGRGISNLFSQQDLLRLQAIKRLLDGEFTIRRIKPAIEKMRDFKDPLEDKILVIAGEETSGVVEEEEIDIHIGGPVIIFPINEVAEEIEDKIERDKNFFFKR